MLLVNTTYVDRDKEYCWYSSFKKPKCWIYTTVCQGNNLRKVFRKFCFLQLFKVWSKMKIGILSIFLTSLTKYYSRAIIYGWIATRRHWYTLRNNIVVLYRIDRSRVIANQFPGSVTVRRILQTVQPRLHRTAQTFERLSPPPGMLVAVRQIWNVQ